MAPLAKDPRSLHLLSCSNHFTTLNQELAAYYGLELVDHLKTFPNAGVLREDDFCNACGSIQKSGVNCTVTTKSRRSGLSQRARTRRSTRPRKTRGDSANDALRSRDSEVQAVVITKCLHCRRSRRVVKTTQPTKPAISVDKATMAASGASVTTVGSDTPGKSVDKKARRKQKKGGLAAMLAQARAQNPLTGSTKTFGFTDLAKKS